MFQECFGYFVKEIISSERFVGSLRASVSIRKTTFFKPLACLSINDARILCALERHAPTFPDNLCVVETIVDSGTSDEASQKRRVSDVKLSNVLPEIRFSCSLKAVGTVTKINLIQVELENFLLGELLLKSRS